MRDHQRGSALGEMIDNDHESESKAYRASEEGGDALKNLLIQ